LRPDDPDFEIVFNYALVEPFFRAIITRIPMTPPEELARLIKGLSNELKARIDR